MGNSIIQQVRWTKRGYHAYPITEVDEHLPDLREWQRFGALVAEAKGGHFERIPVLVDWVDRADDWVRRGEYAQLLGDAGNSTILANVRDSLLSPEADWVVGFVYAQVLCFWGHLSVLPQLVAFYRERHFSEDAWEIPIWMSRLLEETPGPIRDFPRRGTDAEVSAYCETVLKRHDAIQRQLGTEDVIVFRGGKLNIPYLCGRMLDDMRENRFHKELRHKFEAFTGVDCSSFYDDEVFKPLRAAAIIEDFLAGGRSAQFEPGVRYFFGHRIPD